MSGHSKWAQIKHKKAASDARKGNLFSKLVREITITARLGGADPSSNSRLRAALLRSRAEGLPKENIERAIARAAGDGKNSNLYEFLYEATGPAGAQILIEGITDNKKRTLAELRHLLDLHAARLADQGSLLWNFDKVGTIKIDLAAHAGKTKDAIELLAIETGASDLILTDDTLIVETPFAETDKIRAHLEHQGIVVKDSGHDFKPRAVFNPASSDRDALEKLIDALMEYDDVQEVYTNLSK